MFHLSTKRLNVVLALLSTLVLFAGSAHAAKKDSFENSDQNDDSSGFVGVEPGPIKSIDDLRDGVYSFELANTRTSCGESQGAIFS